MSWHRKGPQSSLLTSEARPNEPGPQVGCPPTKCQHARNANLRARTTRSAVGNGLRIISVTHTPIGAPPPSGNRPSTPAAKMSIEQKIAVSPQATSADFRADQAVEVLFMAKIACPARITTATSWPSRAKGTGPRARPAIPCRRRPTRGSRYRATTGGQATGSPALFVRRRRPACQSDPRVRQGKLQTYRGLIVQMVLATNPERPRSSHLPPPQMPLLCDLSQLVLG